MSLNSSTEGMFRVQPFHSIPFLFSLFAQSLTLGLINGAGQLVRTVGYKKGLMLAKQQDSFLVTRDAGSRAHLCRK